MMANNKQPSINVSQTRPVEVSQQLKDGEKFIKWDEVSKISVYYYILYSYYVYINYIIM